jgi:DNA-directed RNA polymerase subunit K/omega
MSINGSPDELSDELSDAETEDLKEIELEPTADDDDDDDSILGDDGDAESDDDEINNEDDDDKSVISNTDSDEEDIRDYDGTIPDAPFDIHSLLKEGGAPNSDLEVDDDSEEYSSDDDSESNYSDSSDMNDEYFKKFEKTSETNYIKQLHPELASHNSDEVVRLSKVNRVDGCIIDPFHKTIPILSKYEKTRILGQRSIQIENGSTPFINVPDNIINSHIIAEMELAQKKIPFIIRRPMFNGGCEYWKIADLEIL